jgi:hypothetical protein
VTSKNPATTPERAGANPAPTTLRWDREVFTSTETEDKRCPELFDLTGRQRFLFYGPYRELPTGLWRAQVELHLSEDAGKRILSMQFGVEPDYTTVDLPRGHEGPLLVELDHAVTVAGKAQLRLWLRWGAIHGIVRFGGVTLRRLGDAAPPAAERASGAEALG